jgi:hypothetical protein
VVAIVGTGKADDDSLRIIEGGAFGVTHSGWVHGLDPGSRTNEVFGEGTSPLLRELWPFFRNGTLYPDLIATKWFSAVLTDIRDAIQSKQEELPGDPEMSNDMREDIRDV